MRKTDFFTPGIVKEALELLDNYKEDAVIVNGGTDIVEKIKEGKIEPKAIIYIQNIEELKEIREEAGYVMIGGAVPYNKILESPVCQRFQGLMEAISEIGSPAIRNVATLAGNIGTAASSADGSVMLLALDAEVLLVSQQGERIINMKDIFVGRGQTILFKNELIQEIRIPIKPGNISSAYNRMARRKAQDIGKILVGVALGLENNLCKDISIALGALNTNPVRAFSWEAIFKGQEIEQSLRKVKGKIPQEAKLRESRFREYKEQVTDVYMERAIRKACERAAGGDIHG